MPLYAVSVEISFLASHQLRLGGGEAEALHEHKWRVRVELEGEELMAVALQHEIDHLDGMLFIDHLSQLKRSRYVARQKKAAAEQRE